MFETIGIIITNAVGVSTSAGTLAEISVQGLVGEVKMITLFQQCTSHQVVENVEIALSRWHSCDSVAFQIVVKRLDTAQTPFVSELELCIFSKARCIWIEEGASVAKGLDDKLCHGHLARELGALLSRIGNGQL